jgi:hypothetical protein
MRSLPLIRTSIFALGLTLAAASVSLARPQQASAIPAIDCDGNGIGDLAEIAAAPEKDSNFNSRLDLCEGFSVDRLQVSVSQGGSQRLHIELGRNMAYRLYWVLGSTAGTDPGINLLGIRVPLNYDGMGGYMNKTTYRPNEDELQNTLGFLDGNGSADAVLTIPPGSDPSLAGTVINHAFVIFVATKSAIPVWSSNSVSLELVP